MHSRRWRRSLPCGLPLLLAMVVTAVCSVAHATSVKASPHYPSVPDLRSTAYLIVDESNDKVLAARNAGVAAPIASITKLMTTLVVLEAGQPLGEMITITRDDVRETARSGSRLAAGVTLSRADLLHLALMSSRRIRPIPRGRT